MKTKMIYFYFRDNGYLHNVFTYCTSFTLDNGHLIVFNEGSKVEYADVVSFDCATV